MTGTDRQAVIRETALGAAHPDRRSPGLGGASHVRHRARLDRAGIPAYPEVDGPHDRGLSSRLGAPRRSGSAEAVGRCGRGLSSRAGAPRRSGSAEAVGPHDRDLFRRAGVARRPVVLPNSCEGPPRWSGWRVPMRP
jgi:hypothetical protein